MPEINWEATVATAAPETPICRLMMQIRSSAILIAEEIIRNTSGILLFPMERMIPDKIL